MQTPQIIRIHYNSHKNILFKEEIIYKDDILRVQERIYRKDNTDYFETIKDSF